MENNKPIPNRGNPYINIISARFPGTSPYARGMSACGLSHQRTFFVLGFNDPSVVASQATTPSDTPQTHSCLQLLEGHDEHCTETPACCPELLPLPSTWCSVPPPYTAALAPPLGPTVSIPCCTHRKCGFLSQQPQRSRKMCMGDEGTMAMVQGHGDTVTGPGPAGHSHGDVAVRATWQ